MKRVLKGLTMMAVFVLAIFTLAACGDDALSGDFVKEDYHVVVESQGMEFDIVATISFREDGTCTVLYDMFSVMKPEVDTTYTVDGDVVTVAVPTEMHNAALDPTEEAYDISHNISFFFPNELVITVDRDAMTFDLAE